jgi:hypothetical protein
MLRAGLFFKRIAGERVNIISYRGVIWMEHPSILLEVLSALHLVLDSTVLSWNGD